MITVRLKGGMGNQMFQYAFGKGMAKKLGTDLKLDLSLLLDRARGEQVYRDYDLDIFEVKPEFILPPNLLRNVYKIKLSKIGKFLRTRASKGLNYKKEAFFHVEESLLKQPIDNTIYDGWWQSARYFEDISETIRKDFQFKGDILPKSKLLFDRIKNSNSICLNVRRTDFLKVSTLNTTNKDYFMRAADFVANQIDNPEFFIFSDDTVWCEENLDMGFPKTVVQHSMKGHKFGNYMQLMKACKHFIIPNSSFAWWAVWLNENKDKIVVAPKNWFNDPQFNTKDLVPKDWVRL